jgi:hypothetical protein
MREIKFRAWNPDNPHYKMVMNPLHRCDPHDLLDGKKEGFYKNWVLMQYTGLKDKNGKEIYQGDVIRNIIPETDTHTGICHMTVDDVFSCYATLRDLVIEHADFEVIGNIYENPELLSPTNPSKEELSE